MQSVKETAANVAASAKSGMEKTKATVQEKVERMTASNPTEKEMATDRKEERIHHAELAKQEVREHNAAAKQGTHTGGTHSYSTTGQTGMSALPGHGTGGTHTYSTTGQTGQPTGIHQMSALPGHGTGGTHSYSTTGQTGQPTGIHQMSALPGHGTGEPMGHVTEGTIKSHPIGTATGTGRTTAHNTHVGGGGNAGYGTGGAYSG